MSTEFEVESESMDARTLQQEISRRVAERRKSGVYSPEVEALLAERLAGERERTGTSSPLSDLDYAATRALSSWEVTTSYPVGTEKRLLGPLVLFFKRLARFWSRIAVGPIIREQASFNRHAAEAIDALRRREIEECARARVEERDLCLLAESLVAPEESEQISSACATAIGKVDSVVSLGPSQDGLLAALQELGYDVFNISCSGRELPDSCRKAELEPLSALEKLSEDGAEALLIAELAFWLNPESLLGLARRSYLALRTGGRIAVAVHGFASGGPTQAWCSPVAVSRALELAGFKDIEVAGPAVGETPDSAARWYVASGRK